MSRTIKVIFALILAGLVLVASPGELARAQTGLTYTANFEGGIPPEITFGTGCGITDDLGFGTLVPGPSSYGKSLQSLSWDNTGSHYASLARIVFPELVDISTISARFYYEAGYSGGNGFYFCDAYGDPVANNAQFNNGNDVVRTYGSVRVAAVYFWWYSIDEKHGYLDDISISYDLTGITFDHSIYGENPSVGPYKPVSQPDQFLTLDYIHLVTQPNANVHAVNSGRIVASVNNGGTWAVQIAPLFVTDTANYIAYSHLQSVNGSVGDMVQAGCVLGLAAAGFDSGELAGKGLAVFNAPSPMQTEWPGYDDSPNNTPCDASKYQTQNCLNINPGFADLAKSWNSDGHVEMSQTGPTLYSGADIYQDVPLDDAEAYIVTVFATTALTATNADLRVTFGGASSVLSLNVPVANARVELATQALPTGAADYAPDKYRLKITNVPRQSHLATPVQLIFVCIGTTAPVKAPGACYFQDPDFNTDDWVKGEGVTYTSPINGSGFSGKYTIPAESDISHNVHFSAFSDHDTKFILLTKTGNALITSPSGRWHAFIRDSVTLDTIQEIGTWDPWPIIATPHALPFTLTAGTAIDGDLVIQNISDEVDSPGWDMNVYSLCLSVDGGVWPSYDNSDSDSLFQDADCTVCAQPAPITTISTDGLLSWVVSWLQFGWCYLGYVLRCLLLQRINELWEGFTSWLAGFALFGVWLGLVASALAAWLQDGLRFAFNNLMASLIPIANQVIGWLFSQPFFLTVLDAAAIAWMWIQALYAIVIGVFNLLALSLQLIGGLLHLIVVAWNATLAAISGTSSITFPFPDCNNPSSSFYDACLILDTMNFMFSEVFMLAVMIDALAFIVAWKTMKKAWAKGWEILSPS
jgi:hypothetical protein